MRRIASIILIVLAVGFIADAVYKQMHKQGPNLALLPCQKEVVVFDKIYDTALFKKAQKALFEGSVFIHSSIKKSHYMPTRLFEYVDINDVDRYFTHAILQMGGQRSGSSKLSIEYYVYENDKDDPGKKTAKAKAYAGYLHINFLYDDVRCYTLQIDFMDDQGGDIPKRIDCALKTFLSL